MRYKFDTAVYVSTLEHRRRYARGKIFSILDTGATKSTLNIASLAKLLNVSAQEIYDRAQSNINAGQKYDTVTTASGNEDRTIQIKLINIKLAECNFPEFYCRLNIDNKSWENDNNYTSLIDNGILIGLDIIRNGEIKGNKDYIEIDNFNVDLYLSEMRKLYSLDKNNLMSLYGIFTSKK